MSLKPVLFEPSGRVWFSLRRASHSMLVGYDGKTWIDYAIADETNSVSGECATDGRMNEGRANRFAGGTAWFIMAGECCVSTASIGPIRRCRTVRKSPQAQIIGGITTKFGLR